VIRGYRLSCYQHQRRINASLFCEIAIRHLFPPM
jgi:hypothetical protein